MDDEDEDDHDHDEDDEDEVGFTPASQNRSFGFAFT